MLALALHSHFSLMRGTASPRALCQRARALGYTHLALTDVNNLYGLWAFLAACEEEGVLPLIGAEVRTTCQRVFCLVKTRAGYRHLCHLLTLRHQRPDFSLQQALAQHHQGLVLLTTDASLLHWCRELGADVGAALLDQPSQHTEALRREARSLGIPAVAMQDVYTLSSQDASIHRLLLAIEANCSLDRVPAMAAAAAGLLSPQAFAARFTLWPESLAAAEDLLARCCFRSPYQGVVMPPWKGADADGALRQRAYAGAKQRYGTPLSQAVRTRLEHELQVIGAMNFSSYFLVVQDIVGPVARTCGRGSGAASLVAYCLFITNICPLRYSLYFERFLHPGRLDPPDIDVDFPWDERAHILRSVLERFGTRAAMVANHVALQPRMAIREVAKVFGLPDGEISRISKKLPWIWRAGTSEAGYLDELRQLPQLRGIDFADPWPDILQLAARVSGVPRYLSVHPGGVILTPQPVADYVPVQQAAKGVPLMQWDKDGAEAAGLVKIDLLGNRSLGVIRDTLAQVRRNGHRLEEDHWLPEKDPATCATVARGETMGCFYIESPATRLLQRRSGRGDFAHVVLHSSIIRPAANAYIREYLRRLHGSRWQPLHPLIGTILDETYGIMVYQEDVSRVAVQFGFTHAEADRLRKIMAKKDKDRQLADYCGRFFAAARKRAVPEAVITRIWRMMLSFEGYSFCKPHSASYARVSFQAAYLKTHFPAEFMAAVLSNQGGFYSAFAYVSEARRLGLVLLPPDVNQSQMHWQGQGRQLRVGLMAIKTVSTALMTRLLQARRLRAFSSVYDFFQRVRPEVDAAQALIHAGALDSLPVAGKSVPGNRSVLMWLLASWHQTRAAAPGHLFPLPAQPPMLPPEEPRQRFRNEFRVLGFLLDRHPITFFTAERRMVQAVTAQALLAMERRRLVKRPRFRFIGWLITAKIVGTKQGDPMEFLTFEDETGLLECTLFPNVYRRYSHLLSTKGPLLLTGYLEEEFGARTLTVEQVAGVPQRRGTQGRAPGRGPIRVQDYS